MTRLTRAQQQAQTRATVLTAARQEFSDHGYVEAKIDRIAERAELTRGAVYSNFTGKRALYLAVLVDTAERAREAAAPPPASPGSVEEALGEFARVWLARLPLVDDPPGSGHLQLRSLSGVLDESGRVALAGLVRFEALLLGLTLESRVAARAREVRPAGLALTLLQGAIGLAENAPGVGDPFDLVRAAEHLAGLAVVDDTPPPHLAYVDPARSTADDWDAPAGLHDEISGHPVDLVRDGVLVVLGVQRLGAAEEAVRAVGPGDAVTVVVVTGDPAETGRLARLRIVDLVGCLRRAFRPDDLPRLHVVLDDRSVAHALGVLDVDDHTEVAVGLHDGKIVARSEGLGAGHAAATAIAIAIARDDARRDGPEARGARGGHPPSTPSTR